MMNILYLFKMVNILPFEIDTITSIEYLIMSFPKDESDEKSEYLVYLMLKMQSIMKVP